MLNAARAQSGVFCEHAPQLVRKCDECRGGVCIAFTHKVYKQGPRAVCVVNSALAAGRTART